MSILFLRLINSSLLCTLTSLRQWLFLLCSVTTFCSYRTVSHQIRWELISCCTSMWFWFRVETCWFLSVILTVKNVIWCSFWNVIVCQNISVSVAVTASDMIMLFTVLYATMMFLLSSQMMRTTTMSMRVSLLLSWDRSHWHCQWGWLSSMLPLKYVQLFFLLCTVLV